MVQLIIQIPSVELGSSPEWAVVELQGDLETRHGDDLSGKPIGNLHFTHKGIPVLIIGHHILYGKVVKLEKPFAVIEKFDKTNHMDTDADEVNRMSYDVKAFVYRKLFFKTRPKPIIANVPKKI
ncbi:chromosome transmission fidelity protein 8 homolog [Lineus longissimus]|uniref:chromosome transmission fidelity protein 8 homolog n=1 Tax=Lineus longissimus TaxID=88925 RepID=UPI002B4D0770